MFGKRQLKEATQLQELQLREKMYELGKGDVDINCVGKNCSARLVERDICKPTLSLQRASMGQTDSPYQGLSLEQLSNTVVKYVKPACIKKMDLLRKNSEYDATI